MLVMPILIMLTFTIMSKAEFTVLVPKADPTDAARTANKIVKASKRLLKDATDDADSSFESSEDQEKDEEKDMVRYNEEREEDTIDESQEDESEHNDEEEEKEHDPLLRSVSSACRRKMHKFCHKTCKSAYRELCFNYNCRWHLRREFNKNCKSRCKK